MLKNLMKQEVVAYSLRVNDQYCVHQSCSNESCRTKMAWQMVTASANKPAHPLLSNVGLLSFRSPVVARTKNPVDLIKECTSIVTKHCPLQERRHLRMRWNHIRWKIAPPLVYFILYSVMAPLSNALFSHYLCACFQTWFLRSEQSFFWHFFNHIKVKHLKALWFF